MDLAEARGVALARVQPLGVERIAVENAVGRVLALPVHVNADLPPSARSALDGFAVRSDDTQWASADNPAVLGLLPDCLPAGASPLVTLEAGQTVQILTGASIPLHADAVVPVEQVVLEGKQIRIDRVVQRHEGLRLPGEEAMKGEGLLSQGQILTPTRLAMLTALGLSSLQVFARPRVAVLATGDEVRELGEVLEGPWTYCNNRHLIGWLTSCHGGVPLHAGIAPDKLTEIIKALRCLEAEVIITTGGIGRSAKDFVLRAWAEIGVQVQFREINLIPGKNSGFGSRNGQLLFALPGNPWGAQVIFEELVAPVLRKFQGLKSSHRPRIKAALVKPIKKREGFFTAVRGALGFQDRFPSFEPLVRGDPSSSLFSLLKRSLAYTLLGPEIRHLPAGQEVEVFLHDCPLSSYPLLLDSTLC